MGTLYISNKNGNIFSDNFYEGGVEGAINNITKKNNKTTKNINNNKNNITKVRSDNL